MKFICLAVAILLGMGCSSEVRISIVLPDGYQGVFHVIPLETSPTTAQHHNGRYEYVIPSSGVLMTPDASAFGEWHSLKAAFSDGTQLHVSDQNGSPPFEDKLGLFSLGVDSEGVRKFFVGTDREYASIKKKNWKDL